MFTGLVEAWVPVEEFTRRGSGARLILPPPAGEFAVAVGDSVAVSGVCLTVAEVGPGGTMAFDLSGETLARSWFAGLEPGRVVNLERALRLGDRLGGHLVSGHVDGGAEITSIKPSGDGGSRLDVRLDPGFDRYLVDKGSITLDGISLTVVEPRGRDFWVAVIPHTLAATSLARAVSGQRLNVEVDSIAKWIERLMPPR